MGGGRARPRSEVRACAKSLERFFDRLIGPLSLSATTDRGGNWEIADIWETTRTAHFPTQHAVLMLVANFCQS